MMQSVHFEVDVDADIVRSLMESVQERERRYVAIPQPTRVGKYREARELRAIAKRKRRGRR